MFTEGLLPVSMTKMMQLYDFGQFFESAGNSFTALKLSQFSVNYWFILKLPYTTQFTYQVTVHFKRCQKSGHTVARLSDWEKYYFTKELKQKNIFRVT